MGKLQEIALLWTIFSFWVFSEYFMQLFLLDYLCLGFGGGWFEDFKIGMGHWKDRIFYDHFIVFQMPIEVLFVQVGCGCRFSWIWLRP